MRGRVWLGVWLGVLLGPAIGCRIPNEDHCGRRSGDATCAELDPSRPYCSLCEAEHDGCVASLAEVSSDCRPDGSETQGETTTTTETGSSESGSETQTETGSTETGDLPECGNGLKEPGEACDGIDFGDASCADPYQLPEGELVCVPGECVVDTSQCCLMDGQVCEQGECCNANCNLVTNKCGL